MSRSYRKYLSQEHCEFTPPDWKNFRRRERLCIHNEFHNKENGEIIFPEYYGSAHKSWYCSKRWYYSKTEIRDDYFEEINNILNDLHYRRFLYYPDNATYQKLFIKCFYHIKNGLSGKKFYFKWLNAKETKMAIKNWYGEPLDVLYYLNSSGIIERAVRNECKRMLRKWKNRK